MVPVASDSTATVGCRSHPSQTEVFGSLLESRWKLQVDHRTGTGRLNSSRQQVVSFLFFTFSTLPSTGERVHSGQNLPLAGQRAVHQRSCYRYALTCTRPLVQNTTLGSSARTQSPPQPGEVCQKLPDSLNVFGLTCRRIFRLVRFVFLYCLIFNG